MCVRKIHKGKFVILALAIYLSLFITHAVAGDITRLKNVSFRRNIPEGRRNYLIKKSLERFVFAINNGVPGVLRSCYQVSDSKSDESNRYDYIKAFFNRCSAVEGRPMVYIYKPRIRWHRKTAFVRCKLFWNVVLDGKEVIELVTDEKFKLEPKGGKYIISKSNATDLIFREIYQPSMLKMKLKKAGRI